MKNGSQRFPESTSVTYVNTTGAAIASGSVVSLVSCLAVAAVAIAIGGTGMVDTRGEYILAKVTGVAFTQGQPLGWDAVNNRVDVRNAGNRPIGYAKVAAASGDTTCLIELDPGIAMADINRLATAGEDTANAATWNTRTGVNPTSWFITIINSGNVTRLPAGAVTWAAGIATINDAGLVATDRIVGIANF